MTIRRMHSRGRRSVAAIASVCLVALVLPAIASAATAPTVTTGQAREVGYASAVLGGLVDPQGQDTTYFFQYGPTKAYGSQTALAPAGAGVKGVHVSLQAPGLQPVTTYHFRLIAVNASGAATGHDETFTTPKIPLSLQIVSTPNPVPFGGTVIVQGTLSGTGGGNRPVVLQANSFPFTQGFGNLGNPQLTSALGGFTFPVLGLTTTTQFRVLTTTSPLIVSPVITEASSAVVQVHVSRTHRRHFVRIYGTVTPAEDGGLIGILKVVHGRYVLVSGTNLLHNTPSSSRFSRVVHTTPGIYRVLARVTDGAHTSAYSEALRIG